MNRREFIGYGLAACLGLGGLRAVTRRQTRVRIRGHAESALGGRLAVIRGNAPSPGAEPGTVRAMTRRAVDALGGMNGLVREGQRVVIKPNMAWNARPAVAANTNPWVVAALVEMCLEAGASRVRVLDHTISSDPRSCYEASGIAEAAAGAGAQVVYVDPARFREVSIADGYALASWPFYDEFINADVCDILINVPVLKHHGTSRLSMGMKNVLGMVDGERGDLHKDIHRKIADLSRVVKVDLTVMDAYRVIRRHGPTGGAPGDVDNTVDGARRIVAGADPVAVDSYGASMFGFEPRDIGFIAFAEDAGLGSSDWKSKALTL